MSIIIKKKLVEHNQLLVEMVWATKKRKRKSKKTSVYVPVTCCGCEKVYAHEAALCEAALCEAAPLCFGLIAAAVQKNSKDLTMQEDMRSHIMGGR